MIIEIFKSEVQRLFPGMSDWNSLTVRQRKIVVMEVLRHRTDPQSQKHLFLVEANIPSARTYAFSDDTLGRATQV